jgi:hypothetical protein
MDKHCQVVSRALTGEEPVDERTCGSVGILAERLEQLQAADPVFAGVEFSPDAEALRQRARALMLS